MSSSIFSKFETEDKNQERKPSRLAGAIPSAKGPALPAVDRATAPAKPEEPETGFSSSLFSELGNPRAHKSLIEMPEEGAAETVADQPSLLEATDTPAAPLPPLPAFAAAPEVRAKPPAPAPAVVAEATPQPTNCPKCQQPLTDAQGLGWCRACGYCRSLDDDKGKSLLPKPAVPRKPSRLGLVEFLRLSQKMPEWAGILLFSQVMIFGCTFLLTMNLTPGNSLFRSSWCSIQIGVGIAMIFASQLWGLALVAADDGKLTMKDAIFSPRVWHLLYQKLPATRWNFWLAGWGVGIITAAFLFVGGIMHWLDYLPKSGQAAPSPPAFKK